MRFSKLIIVLFFGSSLFMNLSCSSIYIRSMGMKPPFFETDQSLGKFIHKDSIDVRSTYLAVDSISFEKLNYLHDGYGKILIFNKAGNRCRYVEKQTCPGPVENYLNGICNRTAISIDTTVNLRKVLPLCKPFDASNNLVINNSADLTVVIFWAVYFGKSNSDLHKWNEVLQKQKQFCSINILFVNVDYRAVDFGYTVRTKAKTGYSATFPKD